MQVNQIKDLMNDITFEILGDRIVEENLQNIVDVGTSIFNATSVDNYVKSLVNHVGKVIFVDRVYRGSATSVLMDAWEYGSVLEKIHTDLPQATENESWSLVNGQSYDPNIFYQPTAHAKFYNKRVTFEIPMSFTEKQVKESFSNPQQLASFIAMIRNSVEKSMTVKLDGLVSRTINAFMGELLQNGASINLFELYGNVADTTGLDSIEKIISNPDFIRFATYTMSLYSDRLTKISKLFNIGETDKFTPKEYQHMILLSDFARASEIYLQSNTYHNDLVKLGTYETVPFWQSPSRTYDVDNNSRLSIQLPSDGTSLSQSGILGVIFDRDALGVSNLDLRVTSNYNPKGEFFNEWYKMDAGYFIDTNENGIVFFVDNYE